MSVEFERWIALTPLGESRFERQTEIIRAALATPGQALDRLLALMRSGGESCIYLAGTRLDSAFGFGSTDLGLALSVLPEDGAKAAVPAYHPGSTELYVVISGNLMFEHLASGTLRVQPCRQHEVMVFPPGRCHRVRLQPEARAASLIVKTNLAYEPAVVRCADCSYYPAPGTCPLHASWSQETARLAE